MTESVTVVIGASNQIGYFLIPVLLAEGRQVIAVSRQALPSWFKCYANEPRLQWCNMEQFMQCKLSGGVNLVSSGPLHLAGNLATKLAPAKVIAISSASVLFKQHSPDSAERESMANIIQAEQKLSHWAEKQQVDLHILQPTLVYGCGLDQNISRVAGLIQRFGFIPLASQALGLRAPVHAQDLANLIQQLLQQNPSGQFLWPLAGGSQLSYRQMLESVFTALEKPVRFAVLPQWLLRLLSRMVTDMNSQMINRQSQDLCVDDAPARSQLHWNPRDFELQKGDLFTAPLVNP
ncbi:MAG: hypothetical protein L3J22_04910 [Xanthomonadales bacterium]|nr:hypothetical protein [Xanthomonadales bacterium]